MKAPFFFRILRVRVTRSHLGVCGLLFALMMPVSSATLPDAQDRVLTFADPNKVLRTVFPVAETGFDPAVARDLYSNAINSVIFEGLYTYDYLASPARVVPALAEALPDYSADGRVLTIRIKKGVYFATDPAFSGKSRELTAEDFIYSFKRLMDPNLGAPHTWLLEHKIEGLDEAISAARISGHWDARAQLPGLRALDRYTLQIRLTRPDYNFPMILAYTPLSAMAHEVVERYRDAQGAVMDHPVGTGPFRLTEWVRGSKIVLDANRDYRPVYWHAEAGDDPENRKIAARMQGKRLPQIGRVVVSIMLEDQSRLLAFQKDEVDLFQLYGGLAPQVLKEGRLRPEYAKKGVQLSRIVDPEHTVYYWNMRDPLVGGFSKEKIALRRAMAMAHDVEEEIRIVDNGEAVPLEYLIPPGVVGYDPSYRNSVRFDPEAANALLDRYGYTRGADGMRRQPNGAPLTIRYTAQTDSRGHLQAEVWKKSYARIGIRMEEDIRPYAEILKAERQCQIMARNSPWIADYPDGDNFMQLFYSKNIFQNNNGCVTLPEFDALYEQSQRLPDGAARNALYRKMARLLEVYAVNRIGFARYHNMLAQPRVIGYKKHPILHVEWPYLDIAPDHASSSSKP